MKLMKKMMIMAVVMILIPVLLLGGGSYYLVSSNMEQAYKNNAKKLTEIHKEMIQNEMEFLANIMEVIALNEQISEVLENKTNENKEKVKKYLDTIQKDNKDIVEMFVLVDTKGSAVVSNTSTNINVSISDREYFKECVKTNKTSFSDVIINKETGLNIMASITPVIKNNRTIGFIVGTIPFKNFETIVEHIKLGENGYGYLVNKDGLIISHKDKDVENNVNLLESNDKVLLEIAKKMVNGETGDGMYSLNGVKKYVSFTNVGKWSLAITANYNDYMASAIKIKNMTISIGLFTFAISLIFSYIFSKYGLVKPINKLVESMLEVGSGNLRIRSDINTKGEIKTLSDTFNKMIDMQSNIIKNIRSSSDVLLNTAEELSSAAEETSSATEEITVKIENISEDSLSQTKEIENINNSFDALFEMIENNTSLALETSESSKSSLEIAENGKKLVNQTVISINKISNETDSTVRVLTELDGATKRVSGISETINDIAESINLLALNASIEAARAGEHGLGFSVVAEEIKKLAEQTANESLDIQNLISQILDQVSSAKSSIDDTKISVDDGVSAVKKVDIMFSNIIETIEKIVERVETIGSNMKIENELAYEMKELVAKVKGMAEATSANTQEISSGAAEQAAAMETMATSAEETSRMADELFNLVSNFKI